MESSVSRERKLMHRTPAAENQWWIQDSQTGGEGERAPPKIFWGRGLEIF